MKTRAHVVAVLAVAALALVLVGGCSGEGGPGGYLPPSLSSGNSNLTIADVPIGAGDDASGNFPADGRYLGFVFQASAGESYDIVLKRTSGNDVPALVLYQHLDGQWSEALAWASADADQIGIRGWEVPADGTYMILIEMVAGDGSGTFVVTLSCEDGCGDPNACASDDDCAPGEVCWNGLCFADGVECRSNDDCLPHEVCQNGFCVASCNPSPEICDGIDNDCDGEIDEGCEQQPCQSDSDCAAGEACIDGLCMPFCECATDADCPRDYICVDCMCIADDCPDDDGDGYNVCAGDCDDANAQVHPGAVEECDGLDNDCDGVIDEGCGGLPCSADADCPAGQLCWDGTCVMTCRTDDECPAGQVCLNGICQGDCQPQPEVCDGLDNDCDGEIDEDFDFATDPDNCGGCGMVCEAGMQCVDGVCTSGGCASDDQCADGQACCAGLCVDILFDEDNCGGCGTACAQGERCERGVCVANSCNADSDCEDGNPCTLDLCDAATGTCFHQAAADGTACDDGNACTSGDVCVDAMCVGTPDPEFDQDGDGFFSAACGGSDCDDTDATIHPGAAELCDGIDNDCDGQIDEGCGPACGSDSDCAGGQSCCAGLCVDILFDEDNCGGCGTACAAGERCERGVCVADGCSSDADCDDGDPNTSDMCVDGVCVHGPMTCSSDADCPADMLCIDGLCMYDPCPDEDGDGWCTCDGDCDDSDPSVHPGATEICDGLDNDCDGEVDEGCNGCSSDDECAAGEVCYNGECVLACSSDADCDDGDPDTADYCIDGVCSYR